MSFVFRGTRADIESSFPGIVPERRVRIHAARPVNANSLALLVTVLLLFVVLNSHQMSPNFLLWLVFGFFLMATSLRMYATCQQLQAQAQAHAVAASGLLRHTELRLQMPPSIAFASRGRLQGLRLQLALLDREFDDLGLMSLRPFHQVFLSFCIGSSCFSFFCYLYYSHFQCSLLLVDYETLRALDADNVPSVTSMSEEQINALPVHKYKVTGPQSGLGALQHSPSSSSPEKPLDISINVGSSKGSSEDDLTCSVCLEQVNVGDLIRSLPCLHQYHANCIDPWLRQQGTCPVCKFKVGAGWHEEGHVDASYMV